MRRADELLRQMTIEEKAMQLSCVFPVGLFDANGPIKSQLDAQLGHGIGHVGALGLIGHKTPEKLAKSVNVIQKYLVTIGFPTYTYPTALKMTHARATGGDIAMAGVDIGGGASAEAKAAIGAELAPAFKMGLNDYIKSNYPAASLDEAVRTLLPNAQVTVVAGTGVVPSEPTDIPPRSSRRRRPTSSSSPSAAGRRGPTNAPKGKFPTPQTRTSPRSRWR